jgi:glycerophosphoryl diester phosphodiesterase
MVVKPQIWGHRGAYGHAPENTLTAFRLAVEMGAGGVELDIQLSKDGEIVVIHDETVDRTSTGSGNVCDFTLAELKKFNFNKRGITTPLFMEIPTLSEVFELLKTTGADINVEFKTNVNRYAGIEKKALALAEKYGLMKKIVWSSFSHYSVYTIKQLEPLARTALLCGGGILITAEQCEKTGAEALHCDVKQMRYPGLVEDCHTRGVKIRPWVVNAEADLRLAKRLGVDAVMTNNIDTAKAVIRS